MREEYPGWGLAVDTAEEALQVLGISTRPLRGYLSSEHQLTLSNHTREIKFHFSFSGLELVVSVALNCKDHQGIKEDHPWDGLRTVLVLYVEGGGTQRFYAVDLDHMLQEGIPEPAWDSNW